MLKTKKVRRKTFAAREDFMKRMNEIAKEKGFSLYSFVNEVFELALRAEELKVSLQRLIEERGLLKAAKQTGFILCLESLWYEMAELAYKNTKRNALKSWFEAGVWLAKRYLSSEVAHKPFMAFKRDLEAFTWNVSEMDIEQVEDRVLIRVLSPKFSESYTLLFSTFIEGTLETFGYKTSSKEISRGTIRIEASREGANVGEPE